ncbi:MAG TPA: serine/threonine-protein kinase, partial [Thermoanaerobaculia bacterium]|nr:serine/threonine-protein kinase [Thermoanaerobaculia bacterium]
MPADDPTSLLWPRGRGPTGPPGGIALGPGQLLGRYYVLQEIGRGGMGVVYAAFDPELDRKVALKILHSGVGRDDGEGQARLLREAKALARLSHPNVIQVYDAGAVGGGELQVFVAMELAEGMTLDRWLLAPRSRSEVLAAFSAAGRGLAAAHAAGLVHRDFKPSNVLLGDDGRVRVLDFGIARPAGDTAFEPAGDPPQGLASGSPLPAITASAAALLSARGATGGSGIRLDSQLTRAGFVPGTPRYMAPEGLEGRPVDAKADQYSFCAALHEALYGLLPYDGHSRADLLREVRAGRRREPPAGSRVPAYLRRILDRGLAIDPAARYPSMDALLADLGRDRAAERRRWAVAAALAALVGFSVWALASSARRQDRTCAGSEARLAGIWDPARKGVLRRAFLASGRPFAADAWKGVERALDAYARGWIDMRREACEATHRRGEQSAGLLDLRMRCLDRRLRDVTALTGLFAAGAAKDSGLIERAVSASQDLPSLAQCADVAALTAPVPPPASPAARRAVGDLEGRIAAARALYTTGKYGDGLQAAEATAQAAAKLGYAPVEAEALDLRAQLEDAQGAYEKAEATLFAALAAAQKGHHDALVARAWTQLVWEVGFHQTRFDEGERWGRMAAASLDRLGGAAENPELDADLASNLGAARDLKGDHAAGVALETRALAIYEKALGPDHPSVSRALNRLGNAWFQGEHYTEALAAYRKALELTLRTLGPRHPTVAVRLGNIALVLEAQGRTQESLATQLRALRIEEAALGPDHPRLAATHGNLSGLLLIMDRPEEALVHARRALEIDQASGDPADLGISWLNVSDNLLALGRFREALATNASAREQLQKAVGPKHPWTATAEASQGRILFALGRPAEAIGPLRRANAVFPADDLSANAALARLTLARALWATGGDRSEAVALAR